MRRPIIAIALPLACAGRAGAPPAGDAAGAAGGDAGDAGDAGGGKAALDLFDGSRVVEVRIEIAPEDWRATLADPVAERYVEGDLVFDGVRVERVAVRPKGNSSLRFVAESGSHRFSFKVDLNRHVEDQELGGKRKLNLNNGFKDPTLVREHLGYALMREAGVPAARTAFVDLTVAGEHLGLYTLVEQVDGSFLRERFGEDDGPMYKPEPPAGSLAYRGGSIEDYPGAELERGEGTDHAELLSLLAALDRGDRAAIEAVVDADGAIAYLAVSAVTANLDSYLGTAHNYYLAWRAGRFAVIPWDLNEAFGNFSCGCDRDGLIGLPIDEPVCGPVASRPLVERLLSFPELRDRYHALVRELIDGPMSEPSLHDRASRAAELIRPYVEADPTRFFTVADFERGLRDDVRTGAPGGGLAIGLAAFARERGAAVRAQLDGEARADAGGRGGCPATGGPGPPRPCGDGVCDAFETANPGVCPEDCGG